MNDRRVFLGWDRPCLERAARWLLEEMGGPRGEMGDVVVAVTAGRAGRRLMEIMAQIALEIAPRRPGWTWSPPRVLTIGSLPEAISHADRPTAGAWDRELAWASALRRLKQQRPEMLEIVVRRGPDDGDPAGWLDLARRLAEVSDALAVEGMTFADVVRRCAAWPDFPEEARWTALAEVERRQREVLAEAGLCEQADLRRAAIEAEHPAPADTPPHPDVRVVLLGVLELGGVHRRLLDRLGDRVRVLVQAPAGERELYDPWGCPLGDAWERRGIDLSRARVRFVDRWRDQAIEAAEAIADAAERLAAAHHAPRRIVPDEVTIGLGDDALGPWIERELSSSGLPVRPAVGRSILSTGPGMLLRSLADFLGRHRLADLAGLVRHPDVEAHLSARMGDRWPGSGALLSELDTLASEHLLGRLDRPWPAGVRRGAGVRLVYQTLHAMLAPMIDSDSDRCQTQRPIGHWSVVIARILAAMYATREFRRNRTADAQTLEALESIGRVLEEQRAQGRWCRDLPPVDLAAAIRLTLARLAGAALAPSPIADGPCVELMGWLELHLDDAPLTVVTGLNEGSVPSSVGGDAFLPDGLRSRLGLADDRQRRTRDAAALQALASSREALCLIAARTGPEGEPLKPSRLLLARPDHELPGLMLRYLGHDAAAPRPTPPTPPRPQPLTPDRTAAGFRTGFVVPLPVPPDPPISSLSVTAFGDYLRCPYRFYLRHVRRLEPIDDSAAEMAPNVFGTVAHEIVRVLGEPELREVTEIDALSLALSRRLDRVIEETFGQSPPASVVIQREQLRSRLMRLADWEAAERSAGWRTLRHGVEEALRIERRVDGRPFVIRGRIDRVDRHPDRGWRVLDYKSAETPVTPDRAHRRGRGEDRRWIDLQLPLYRLLVESLGVPDGRPVQLGYLNLSKRSEEGVLSSADWGEDELATAWALADEVIRGVRAGVFWPPRYPVDGFVEYAGICQDALPEDQRRLAGTGSDRRGDRHAQGNGGGR